MKHVIFLVAILLFSIIAKAQEFLGDVKYSVLAPAEFIRFHPGWILMDGGATQESKDIFEHSKLHDSLGVITLPDGRGVFIRGMNENRNKDSGDADGNREIGKFQYDAFQGHYHKSYMNKEANAKNDAGWGVTTKSDPKNDPISDSPNWEPTREPISDGKHGAPRISSETRSRNIPLYIYIKVN